MGLFDTIKKKNEAKKLGLTVEQYEEYIAAQEQGISINEYMRYLSSFSDKYSVERFVQRLKLEEKGFTPQECDRYFSTLAEKIQIEDYSDFLEAERLGLTVEQYASYSSSLKTRMSAVDYVGFLNAQKIGMTLGKYLQYLKSYKDEMTIEEYDIFLKAEEYGMDLEHYREYLDKYKDRFTVERYLEFDKSRSLGMTLEEYDLRIEAAKSGMSLEQYSIHKEAETLQMSDEEYIAFKSLQESNAIIDGKLFIPETLTELPRNVFKHLSFCSIVFPKSLIEIPDNAFEGCSDLAILSIPANVKKIGCEAFKDCTNIISITIENGVEEIGDSAFEGCRKLKELFIPGSVNTFDHHAVYKCDSLEKLEFEYGVQAIYVSDWEELDNLKMVLTPATASIRYLSSYKQTDDRYGIINPEYRHSIAIDSKIDYISPANYAKFGLDKHKDEIEYLDVNGDFVFLDLSGFPKLKTVNFSAKGSVRSVRNCPELKMLIYNSFLSDYPSGYVSSDKEREAKIIDVKTLTLSRFDTPALRFLGVGDGALVIDLDHYDSSSLAWVHIPASTSRLGLNTASISAIAIHGNCKVFNETFSDAENIKIIRFDKDGREDGVYSNSSSDSLLPAELPSCNVIEMCFSRSRLSSETLGVQGNVRHFLLPQGISVIDDNAFEYWGLESICIPATIERIGNNAFVGCSNLKEVVFEGIPKDFGSSIFDGCALIKSVIVGGQTLSVSEFTEKYESKPSITTISNDIERTQIDNRSTEVKVPNEPIAEEAPTRSFGSDNFTTVSISDQFTIQLPVSYTYSTDLNVIGENRALIAVLDDEKADIRNPYSATESITVLKGRPVSSTNEADAIAASIGLGTGHIIQNKTGLNARYAIKEATENLTIYLALICTNTHSYPTQIFFNKPSGVNAERAVVNLLQSIELINTTSESAEVQIEPSHFEEPPFEHALVDNDKSERSSITSSESTTLPEIPAEVLYRPGYEPEKTRLRLDRLFEKLDSAYPDKVIVGLHKNHKKWGETVTELYRQLGYPDGNSFLVAYGYTIGTGAAGRPANDPMEIVNELKKRYSSGAKYSKMGDLAAENPDLAPKFKNLQNQADKFFGMTLQKYFVQEGILIGKTDDQCIEIFEALKTRYAAAPYKGKLNDLKAENTDIDWNAINRYYSQSGSKDTFKAFLVKEGIMADQDSSLENKLAEMTAELKKRYPTGNAFSGTLTKLKTDNSDLSLSSLNSLTMQVHGLSAQDYLIQQGIMEESQSIEGKLAAITEALIERYSSGEKKAYSITDLREQNLDLPISSIGNWSKKVFGQNATEYLTEKGVLSQYDWMAEMRIREEKREAEARELEERLAAEMSAPIETVYYEPPIYHVDEIDVVGEEANDWKYKDDYYYHKGEFYIEDYLGDKDCITIPTSINGRRVTNLDSFGLKTCKASTIYIPGSIKDLVGHLGYQNENIKSVIVGEGVESIGESCFSFVKNLSEVKVSRSVISVGDTAFKYTPWYEAQKDLVILGSVLTEMKEDHAVLNVPSGVKVVGKHVAVFKSNVRRVILPETVTTLCESAFNSRGNENIKEFVFTDSLNNIGLHAFGKNKWIESFGDNPIVINRQLYQMTTSGTSVTIPNGVTKICAEVFKENNDIRYVYFPSTLKEIGEEAFAGCQNLVSIDLPEGLERLGKACFYRCKKLSKIYVPNSLIEIGRSAFNSCSALTEVVFGESLKIIGEKAFADCTMLSKVQMSGSIISILPEAFSNCALLPGIVIPNGVTKINAAVFSGCKSLESVAMNGGITEIDKSAFEKCTDLTEIVVPAIIGPKAFDGCSGLKKVTFTAGLNKIEKDTFNGCKALTEAVIPEGTEVIDENAFLDCTVLKRVALPSTLKTIGKCAFRRCSSLETICIPDSVDTIGDNAFEGCSSLSEVTIKDSISNYGLDVFTNTPYMKQAFGEFVVMGGVLAKYLGNNKDVVIPENVTTIGENAFAEAYYVETITIPDTVLAIANKVFGEVRTWGDAPMPKLKKLMIGNGVTSIGDSAFANCVSLTDVSFGTALSNIGKQAFSGCKKLNAIDLSKTRITELRQEAFSDCRSVKSLILPNGIETIGRGAFSGIPLGVVKLPKTVKRVERSSFDGASELIVYDNIDPDAAWASEWKHDKWNGTVNSPLACALLGVPQSYVECQGNTRWRGYHISVLSVDSGKTRYRVFCDSEERDAYRAMMFSAWGKHASFTFEAYDEYFMKTRSLLGRTEMAFCRIQYPEGLTPIHRANYEAFLERCLYIERSARRTTEMIAKEDNVERLQILDGFHAIDSHNIAWIYEEIEKNNAPRCLAYLKERYSV